MFGHLGDRVGRKKALVATLVIMAVGTVGIGLLPTYAQAGAVAPVALVALRLAQGLGLIHISEPTSRIGMAEGRGWVL